MKMNMSLLAAFLYPVIFLLVKKVFDFTGDMSLWLSAVLALLPSLFIVGRDRGLSGFRLPEEKKGSFLLALLYLFSFMILVDYLLGLATPVFEKIFTSYGYSAMTPVPSSEDFRPIVLFYVVLIGPVCEEFCYRYTLLEGLRRHGRFKSILISSLLFGLMHLNFYQGLNAFVSGILLGYAYERYGILSSMALHISCNLLAIVFDYLHLKGLWGEDVISIIFILLLIVFVVGTIIVIRHRRRVSTEKEVLEVSRFERMDIAILVPYVVVSICYTIIASLHRL